MKSNPRKLTSFTALALASMVPGMCFATDATAPGVEDNGDGTVQVGGHTIDPAAGAEVSERKRAPASNFLPIVRGRFPLLLVHAVRFDEALNKMSTKDVAAKMATSVGKVFDIRKGRNFAYLTKDFKPTAADVADAKAWAAQVGQQNAKGLQASGDAALINGIVEQYEKAGLATAEEAAAFAASKPRSNFSPKAEGEAVAAPAAKTAKASKGKAGALPASTETSKAGNADDLLG